MTQAGLHAESLERALQVLRDQIGPRWSGREGTGRAEMVRVLQAALGYDKHLTCDDTNIGSRKIIEANGGQFETAVVVEGQTAQKLRYWITPDELTTF